MYASSPGTVGWAYDNPTVTGTIEDTPEWGQVRMSAPGANFALIGDAEILEELRAMDGQLVTVAGSYSVNGYRVTAWAPGDATPAAGGGGADEGEPSDNGNGGGAGTSDAGTSDAGTSDAGTSDAGTSEAGTSEAGLSPDALKYGAAALLGLGVLMALGRSGRR